MDIMTLGIVPVAAVTVACYMVGMIAKAVPKCPDTVIPPICGAVGGVIGLACFLAPAVGFPAADPLSAFAVGVVSGLAATGINQVKKQIGKGE